MKLAQLQNWIFFKLVFDQQLSNYSVGKLVDEGEKLGFKLIFTISSHCKQIKIFYVRYLV